MSRCAAAEGLPPEAIPNDFTGHVFVNTAIGFMVVETFIVALRYYARSLNAAKGLGVDDVLLPFALLFSYGQQAIAIAMVKRGGVGHRILWNCVHQPHVLTTFAKLQVSNTIVLSIAIALAKIVILYLFLRIFHQKVYRYATFACMGVQVASMIVVIVVACTQCTPLAFIWEPHKHPEGHCIDKNTFWRWGNFPQILTDIAILVLPLPALWALKLSLRDKIGVTITFCTGSIGLVTAIVRFVMFFKIDGQADAGWQAVPLGSISIAETGVYVIAACLPSYRSLFRQAVGHLGTSMGGSRGTQELYGSSGKSTELRSLGKSEKGFSRLQHDEKTGSAIKQTRMDTSEEQLVAHHGLGNHSGHNTHHGHSGPRDIQVQRTFVVSSRER